MAEVIPGINESDLVELERKLALVAPLVPWVQIDCADNSLAPTQTFTDFFALGKVLKKYPKVNFEAHLMMNNPHQYLKQLVDCGFKRLIVHVEADEVREFIEEARTYEVEVGVAIDADTEVSVVEPFLEEVDCILVMTVTIGASGQVFEPEELEKVKAIRRNFQDLPIEVDGGMNEETAKLVREAGATRIVSTSFLFKDAEHILESIEKLRGATTV